MSKPDPVLDGLIQAGFCGEPRFKGLSPCSMENLAREGWIGLDTCTPEYKQTWNNFTHSVSCPFVDWDVAASDPRGTGEGPSSRRMGCSRCSTARTKAAARST